MDLPAVKASPIQQSFNAGELSPLLFARTDFTKYKSALALMRNWVPYIQGGMTRRPGTQFVGHAKASISPVATLTQGAVGEYMLSLDEADTKSDVEVLAKWRSHRDEGASGPAQIYLRCPSYEDSYSYEWPTNTNELHITRRVSNGFARIATTTMSFPREAGKWYRTRFRVQGTALKLKVWREGTPEPGVWDVEVTDTSHATGKTAIGAYWEDLYDFDFVAVAYDGASASSESTYIDFSGSSIVNSTLSPGWTILRGDTTYHQWGIESLTLEKGVDFVPFEFSVEQAYVLEFGDKYIRYFMNHAQIMDGGIPYETVTPYAGEHVAELAYAQSADVLYLVNEHYAPRKLSRTGHTAWSLDTIEFYDGPYLKINSTSTTLAADATTGIVTVTASSIAGINGGRGFLSTDVGRVIRAKNSSNWAWGRIHSYTSTTEIEVLVEDGSFPTTATKFWRLGVWSDTTGWPVAVTFHQNRLWFAGGVESPQRIDGSVTGDYENFRPNDPTDETVADDDACAYTIGANSVNVIRWLLNVEKGLAVGTVGGEWILRANTYGDAITPTNVKADSPTNNGSARVKPVRAGKAVIYVQRARRKIRELAYRFDVDTDGFVSPDITLLAEHITKGGVNKLAYQQEPHSIIWAVRNDGVLLGLSYDRDQDVVGWHQHPLGGTDVAVEAITTIPSPDGSGDDLWLLVRRTVNGSTVRHVEFLTPIREAGADLDAAFYVDGGLTYEGTPITTVTGLDHLEGELVCVFADGVVRPRYRVENGGIVLQSPASKMVVGLGYESDALTLYIEAGAGEGTAQGKTKRIHEMTIRLLDTLAIKMGPKASAVKPVEFNGLYTGDKRLNWPPGYDTLAQVYLRVDTPVPATVLALMPQLRTYG